MLYDVGKPILNLLRWSGMACILAGVIAPLAALIHPSREDVPTILSQTARLVTAHSLLTVAYLLTLLGLVGLLVYQSERIGRLGRAGFLLAFTGILLFAISGEYGFFAPILAAQAPAMLDALNAYGPVVVSNGLMALCYILGFILFGAASARAGLLPRRGGICLAVGAPLFLLAEGAAFGMHLPWLGWVAIAGQVLQGLGLILLGQPLWSLKDVGDRPISPTPYTTISTGRPRNSP